MAIFDAATLHQIEKDLSDMSVELGVLQRKLDRTVDTVRKSLVELCNLSPSVP